MVRLNTGFSVSGVSTEYGILGRRVNPAYLVIADCYSGSDDWGMGGGTFSVLCGGMIGWHGDGQIWATAKKIGRGENPTLLLI